MTYDYELQVKQVFTEGSTVHISYHEPVDEILLSKEDLQYLLSLVEKLNEPNN